MREIKKFGERSASQNKVRLSKYILIMEGKKQNHYILMQ